MTSDGTHPLPSDADCQLVQVNEEDIHSVVKSIPKLDTLILIKTMLKKHSFQNPFSKPVSGRAPQRGGSRMERFTRAGRSNSAPGSYHGIERCGIFHHALGVINGNFQSSLATLFTHHSMCSQFLLNFMDFTQFLGFSH